MTTALHTPFAHADDDLAGFEDEGLDSPDVAGAPNEFDDEFSDAPGAASGAGHGAKVAPGAGVAENDDDFFESSDEGFDDGLDFEGAEDGDGSSSTATKRAHPKSKARLNAGGDSSRASSAREDSAARVRQAPPRALVVIPAQKNHAPTLLALYRELRSSGIDVSFATANGKTAGVDSENSVAARELQKTLEFKSPRSFGEIYSADYTAIALVSAQAADAAFLNSRALKGLVAEFSDSNKAVTALGDGILVVAGSRSQVSGRSPIYGRRTAAARGVCPATGLRSARDCYALTDAATLVREANYLSTSDTRDVHRWAGEFADLIRNHSPAGIETRRYYLPAMAVAKGQSTVLREDRAISVTEYVPAGEILGDILVAGDSRPYRGTPPAYEALNLVGFRVITYSKTGRDRDSRRDRAHDNVALQVEYATRAERSRPIIVLGSGDSAAEALRLAMSSELRRTGRPVRGLLLISPELTRIRGALPLNLPVVALGIKLSRDWARERDRGVDLGAFNCTRSLNDPSSGGAVVRQLLRAASESAVTASGPIAPTLKTDARTCKPL